jgi:hypothetical protein
MQNIGNVHHVAHGVYIGGARAVYLVPELRRAGVTRVLKLYFHIPDWPDDFLVCDNPLEDGVFVPQEVLQHGVSFVREQVEAGEKVLVVCGAGISRSSTFGLSVGARLRIAPGLATLEHATPHSPAPAADVGLVVHAL